MDSWFQVQLEEERGSSKMYTQWSVDYISPEATKQTHISDKSEK